MHNIILLILVTDSYIDALSNRYDVTLHRCAFFLLTNDSLLHKRKPDQYESQLDKINQIVKKLKLNPIDADLQQRLDDTFDEIYYSYTPSKTEYLF